MANGCESTSYGKNEFMDPHLLPSWKVTTAVGLVLTTDVGSRNASRDSKFVMSVSEISVAGSRVTCRGLLSLWFNGTKSIFKRITTQIHFEPPFLGVILYCYIT
jgi:hypothetical protein